MADSPLLGPNGQPLNNPFSSSPSTNTNLSINTQSAQAAIADFSKLLESLTSKFSIDWEKAVNDSLSKQERFYRAIGDRENERRASITRYKNEAIAAIDAETKAKLASIDEQMRAGKLAHDQAEKEKTSLTMKAVAERKTIESKTTSRLAMEGGVGGFIRNRAESIGSQIGGPIGGMISGGGALLTNPWALGAMALLQMFNTKAAFSETGGQLANAGMRLGSRAGAGLDFATGLFGSNPLGGLNQALSQSDQRAIIAQMSGSRTMIDQARGEGGFGAIRNNLGLFANILPDAAKEMEIFTDATKSLGATQSDITNLFISSRINADRLKITQLDAIKMQMDMAKALRNLTNDGAVASSMLYNVSGYLTAIGASEAEKQRIGVSIASAGANLSLPQIAGMFAFTHNGKIPGPSDLFGDGKILGNSGQGPFELMGTFLTKVGKQFSDPTQRMFAANQLQQQFLPGLRMQDLPHFFELSEQMMSGKISTSQFSKDFRGLEGKTPQAAMADGINMLTQIVGPIQRLENVFSNFWTVVDAKINKIFQSLGKNLPFKMERWFTKRDIITKPDASHPTDEHK